MEYMEQQMQNYIEAGINERERCYNEIMELEHLRDKYKELYESSMLSEATAKQYAEEVDKQNKELAAQVEALKQSVISTRARGNLLHNLTMQVLQGAELNSSDWDYISESQVAEIERHIAEVMAQAGRDGFIAGCEFVKDRPFGFSDSEGANLYADSILKGEVER